ncbi:hypothetical protein [Meiothermus sp.]|uniref:hypothetical protein n=1 Tax=Meiothermus sp. TaxID=1955249 RepID=UPI00298EDD1F|nr:hypothetical protein [Meiothermus sp.]
MKPIGILSATARKFCKVNRVAVFAGCVFLSEIEAWVDDEQTALCPSCGAGAALGSASGIEWSRDFLSQMRERYF